MPKYTHSGASPLTQAAAFIFSNTLLSTFLAMVVVPLYLSPRAFTIYFLLPYYALDVVFRWSTGDGFQWPFFARHFPVFTALRRHIGLSAVLSEGLEATKGEPTAQYVFAIFPHGVGSDFRVLLQGMLPDLFPGYHLRVRSLAASVLFYLPFIRELTLWTGCISASRSVADKALADGRTVIVLPGGEAEQLLTKRGREIVYVKSRKGFIRLAIKHKVPVVPVYVFGSNDLFETSDSYYEARHWLMKKYGVCIPLSRGLLGSLCPLPVKNTVVFGEPVAYHGAKWVKEAGEATREEVDRAHADFMERLEALFEKEKGKYGCADRKIEFV